MKLLWKTYKTVKFILFYIAKLFQANVLLAYYILKPKMDLKPAIVKVPIHLTNDQAILLLLNLISMTPWSFTMDLTEDKKYIYVHFLNFSREKRQTEEIKRLEKRVSTLFN